MMFQVHETVLLFAGITIVCLFVRTESLMKQDPASKYPPLDPTFQPGDVLSDKLPNPAVPQTFLQSDSKWISPASRKISALLSSDILSKPDPFKFLIRETCKVSSSEITDLAIEIDKRLKTNQIPKIFMPYAKALDSIIDGCFNISPSEKCIQIIQNDAGRHSIPSEILSLPGLSASGLFSPDIFTDSDPLIRILNTLIQIPKDDIPKIIDELKKFTNILHQWRRTFSVVEYQYILYGNNLIEFLQSRRLLNNLRRDMAEIQRISTIGNENPINFRSPNNNLYSSATSKDGSRSVNM